MQFSLASHCLNSTQKNLWTIPFSRNECWSCYVFQVALHCSCKFLSLSRFLGMLFTFIFLLQALNFSTWISFILLHQVLFTKFSNIFFKANWKIVCAPWNFWTLSTVGIFVLGATYSQYSLWPYFRKVN